MRSGPEDFSEVKKFIKKALIFSFPYLIFFAFTFYLFIRSGEAVSIDSIIKRQKSGEPILLGLAYTNPIFYYKLHSVLERTPRVLVLGSSRTMQIRSVFFSDVASFYNAGGGVSRLKDFRIFLEKIPRGQEPNLIIIGLDHNFFSARWDASVLDEDSFERYDTYDAAIRIMAMKWPTLYHDWFQNKFSIHTLKQYDETRRIGLNALMNNNGFRNDGSRLDAILMKSTSEEHLRSIIEWDGKFFSDGINPQALEELSLFLSEARERDITIIGFEPPFAPSLYQDLLRSQEHLGYIFKLEPELKPLFQKYGYSLYNFTDALFFGSSDQEMLDAIHGSEKTYLRLFIAMAKVDYFLASLIDIAKLEEALRTSINPYQVF